MGKVTAEEMQDLMYGNASKTERSDGSSSKKVSASDMENLMAPYRSQEIKHTVLAPSTQPAQAAPAGVSSRKQSETMKQNVDALKKQRDDALIKAGAYHRAGMKQEEEEQLGIASRIYTDSVNAETKYKTQKNIEATEDYDPSKNKSKAGTAALASLQDFGQSFMQGAGVLSHYMGGGEAAYRQAATSAKNLMDKGVSPKEALETAGLVKKDAAPITDYKTVAELKREKDRASVGTLEGLGLDAVGTVSGMAIPAAVTAITKSPEAGLLLMSVSSLGHKYADAYEKYGNGDLAFVLGLGAGAATYTTEQLGGVYGKLGGTKLGQAAAKKLMSEAPGLYSVANSVGGKWLRDAISEGVEEGAEDIVNYAIEKSLTGESDEMDNFGYDMLLGALAGGVLGGGNAAMRSITYNRLGKALNASPTAVAQQVQEGMEKGAGTAPAIYAAEVQKNPSNQMVGRLYEANITYDAESGLSKIQNDITQVSINEIKAMVSKADALAQAAQKLNVEATPQAVATAITDTQRTQSIKTAEDSVEQAFAPTIDNPTNAGEKAYNSALAGVAANQGVAARINNDPVARQAFSQLTGVQFSDNPAVDIAAIEVATQNIAKSGKQAISQEEYAQRVAAAGEQAAAQFDADMQAQAERMQQESMDRWLSVEQNTITDVDGKRHIKEITNTDVRGNTEIGYKKAEIPNSKKRAVAEVDNAAKYLGKTIVWYEGALQVNGQYRLSNGFRAPDGTIYLNINAENPLMVTFGHEMFHDLVTDGKYAGMIDTLIENPEYAAKIKVELDRKIEVYAGNGINLDLNAAAEEVAADISGDLLGSRDMLEYIGARNTEAATGIKGFLNRILKKLKGKSSAQEAYNRLSEAQRALIDGMEARSDTEEAGKISYSVMDATVKDNNRPFAEQFADYKAGKMRPTDLFYLNNTSEYLQAAGLANEPIVMAQSVVTKAQRKATVDTHGHELSDDVILKLPEMIEKPVLLLKSDTVPDSVVVVTSVPDSSGNPVVVALHLSRNNGFDVVTRIASLYGRKNSRNFIADQLLRGNLIGYSKKEADRLLHRDGLQLPRRNPAVDFDTISVAQDTDAVNNYSMQNSAEDAGGSYSIMDDHRGNGYDGYSMSNNARAAYASGEKPLSNWTKTDIIDAIQDINPDIDCSRLNVATLKKEFLTQTSWHHTSKFYNRTNFYSIDTEYVEGLTQSEVDAIKNVTEPKKVRNASVDASVDDAYSKIQAIVEAGFAKNEDSAVKKLLRGGSLDAAYREAVDTIRERDAKKVDAWRKLPEDHWRKKYVSLYDSDIESYIKEMYAANKLSKNSKLFKSLEKHFNDGGKFSLMDAPAMDSEYSAAVESGNMQEAQRLVDEAANENGYTIKAFHGTSRGDRVGNVFLPERATSGPMAFFTDNREIAERYSRDKADTSLAYDPDFDQYETQFRIKAGKLDVPLIKAWGYLPFDARNRITKKAGQVRMDMDTGDIIVDQSTNEANGGFQWQIKEFKGNTLAALNEQWLNSGTLFNEEGTYLDVLKAAGVFDEFAKVKGMGEPYFKDPKYREEKVYDVFLGIRNPFDVVQDVNNEFIDAFEEWYTEQDQSIYDRETANADMWDKNSITAEEFAERMREDVEDGTTMSWTSIPDSMTDYLKSLGYDGIKDVGGKNGGSEHAVWIPFYSEQVKSAEPVVRDDAGNVIPLSERFNRSNNDIRYSLMDILPKDKYFADIDKAVSEATAKADEELKAAQAQVKDLRKQMLEMRNRTEYAELQTKVTEKPTIDPIKAKKDISQFLRKNGITNEDTINTLTAEIEDAFNSVYRWEKTDIDAAAKKTADAILKEATVADPLKAEKADIRKSLSQRTFVIGEQLRGDIVRKYGSLSNFRKKYGNLIRIKTRENAKAGEGVAFDVAYSELQSEFPGIFREAATEWETFANTVAAADYAMRSEPVPLADMVDSEEFADSVSNQLAEMLWNQKNLVTEADKAKAKADAATEKAVNAAVEAERQRAKKETAANDRWREAETKLLADMAAAKEREKAAKARAEFMQKYDTLSKQYRADLRANSQQARAQYDEKLAEAKDEFNRRRTQDRIDRVVQEDRAKSKARLRTAEQKSTTTEDVAKVLTEMPKKDKEAFKTKAAESWRTFKRQWINTKDELERFGNAVGDSRITYAANNVGQAAAAAQYSIGGAGQYDLNGKKISDKNLTQVFEPAKKAGLTEEFYTYLLHEHNVDRMSVREKARQQLAELRSKLNKEVKGFAEMTDENISAAAGKDAALAKAYTKEQIAAAKQYKQFKAWAEKQFDKPVFGSSVTADDSRAAAADLLDAHPEFEKWAKDVYAYLDGLMEVRKQGGLVSEEMAQRMKELYPHYVPTYRDMPSTSGGYSNPNSVAVNSTIKSAKGGNQDIMPLIDSIARQTLQTFSAAKKNILGNMLYEDAMDTTRDVSEYIQNVTEEGDLVDLDADSAENLKNTLRIWVDGKPVTLHMSEAMADGFRPIEQSNSFGMKALRSVNSTFKKLVTQWNPVFIVRNLVRDAQSALYFTHYSYATFIKNYGKAAKEIATNGKYWQLYQAMGGKGTTYYDPKTGLADRYHFKNGAVDKLAGGLNKVIDILSFANEAVEQYPRLAEFISTMEATGDVQQALYNAADITTNFGRGGFAARKLNASLVPFFNPGMQGLSKNIRNVIDRRGWKEIGQLISRLLINGVAPGLIMSLLYDGLKEDKDYKELSNYIKDSNILIKIKGTNMFIKVPMGREPSVITAFTNRMWRWLKGEPASSAFSSYPSFAVEQIAPNNPLTNNIFAGITAMSTNKTWYGGDIVSGYMEEKPDYLQYDESTDAFSIWLGEVTRHGKNGIEGLSPKKVNYLIDQYSGFIGDWVLPALSKKADVPAVVKAFVVDSVRQNRLGSDFYDALDEAKQVKDTEMATAADDATYSYLYKQSKAASEITKQLKEIYNSGEKTRKEKLAEARDLLELRNEIYRNALLTVGTYEETAKSIGSADSGVVKREANRKAFGSEYALKIYNKDVGEKAAEYVAQGVTYDQYYAAYFATRGITGDKDKNGKTITNSASRKKKEAIDKAVPNATTKQKHLLYEALGVSDKVW